MLPKIEQPYYNTELPMSKTKVRYRPYLMKEQKIILIATSGEDHNDVIGAITQVISNCTDGTVDAGELNAVDIGYIMAKIRGASEGNLIDVNMKCKNVLESGDVCGHLTPMEVDLEGMELTGEMDESLSKIDLGNGIGIVLKAPSIEFFNFMEDADKNLLKALPILIDYVYDSEGSIFKLENEPKESQDEFFDSLNTQNINDISEFLNNIPKIVINVPFQCEKCGHKETVVVEDIQSFLG